MTALYFVAGMAVALTILRFLPAGLGLDDRDGPLAVGTITVAIVVVWPAVLLLGVLWLIGRAAGWVVPDDDDDDG